jgi:hypothetical protein
MPRHGHWRTPSCRFPLPAGGTERVRHARFPSRRRESQTLHGFPSRSRESQTQARFPSRSRESQTQARFPSRSGGNLKEGGNG